MSEPTIDCPDCQTRQQATELPSADLLTPRLPRGPRSRKARIPVLLNLLAASSIIIGVGWLFVPPRDNRPGPGNGSRLGAIAAESAVPPAPAPAPAPATRSDDGRVAAADRGRELFFREWIPDDPRSHGGDGLGPVFNDSSCVACHNLGGAGGGGPNSKNVDILSVNDGDRPRTQRGTERRPGGAGDDALTHHPGFGTASSVVLHRFGTAPDYLAWRLKRLVMEDGSAESRAVQNALNGHPEELPKLETQVDHDFSRRRAMRAGAAGLTRSQRNPTALFGAGAIDSIPDQVIREAARREFPDFPEVKGRVSLQQDGRIGRFGWKAQLPSLREFVVTACAVELGLEAPEQAQGSDPTDLDIKAPGPDLTAAECDDLVAYVRALPVPKQCMSAGDAESKAIRGGKEVFLSIGCGTCHAPDLGNVAGIYSDLLLHDMGPDTSDTGSYRAFRPEPTTAGSSPSRPTATIGDDHRKPLPGPSGATPQEWRTPPLWGLRDSAPYLHDGRAETLEQAIAMHGAQGKNPADRYFGLSPRRRQQLQAFLKSLVAPSGSTSP